MAQRVAKAWSKVGPTDLVEIKGRLYAVVEVKATKKGPLKATIRDTDSGKEYTSKVNPKHGVDVVELAKEAPKKKWTKPASKAEEAVVDILGATLVAEQPGKDETWVCPHPDISTIAGHLFVFHGMSGVEIREPGGWEKALDIHRTEHEKPLGDLHVPHRHEKDRPETQTGPRFI